MSALGQGRFLVEVAAVQRRVAPEFVALVRFADDVDGPVTVTGARTATVPITADRQAIAAAVFPGVSAPAPGDADGFPVTAPPAAVHAEILRDLGVHADALDGYLGGGARYTEIRTDAITTTVVIVAGGIERRRDLTLTPDEPAVGLPYTLMEALHE